MLIIKNFWAKPAALSLEGMFLAALALSTTAAEPDRMELEWSALVPENWEAPMILPAPEADGHYPVDPDSLMQKFD